MNAEISANMYRSTIESLLKEADIKVNGTRPHDIQVHDERFFKRFLKDGRLGLGESYMDGWWDAADLEDMFFHLFRSDSQLQMQTHNTKFYLAYLKARVVPDGSMLRSSQIGQKHYDLGNDLFRAMLDKRMIYTCGLWDNVASLDAAQEAKLEMICKKLKLQPGMTLLDVGCGWGGLCKYAAERYGVRSVGISISQEQLEMGRKECKGLLVDLRYQDYREVTEKFDRIVSVEMFEHVGLPYYNGYFRKMRSCLKDDGIFLFQTGGINISNFTNIWITKYIFPGAHFPSLAEIFPALENEFVMEDLFNMGPHYYHTLSAWSANVEAAWDSLKSRYDERFHRMWRYFLLSCAAGFHARRAQVWQLVLTPKGMVGGYSY